MIRPFRTGIAAALLTLALDQATKLGLLYGYELPIREPVVLGPFANLIVVWNHGISYGLFQQRGDLGRWLLTVVSLIAIVVLLAWMSRAQSRFLAVALGLIAGGALGNAVDRIAYGAVFDFVHLHAGSFSWYVFNIADAAIVAGVAGLIYDGVFADHRMPRPARSDP